MAAGTGGAALGARAARQAARTCCFVAGTLVETETGLRPIQTIAVGDQVWARDVETGETALKAVTDLIRRHERVIWVVTLTGSGGANERFETTDDHPWWVVAEGGPGRWVTTDNLTPGMVVVSRDTDGPDGRMVIDNVTETGRTDATYNLTVADFHTYFVGERRVLVHNCNLPKPPQGPGRVPRDQRDPIRTFSPSQREAKRQEQGNQCANGCGTEIDASNSEGHHIQRHADGGPTTRNNHAEVCIDCHRELHSPD